MENSSTNSFLEVQKFDQKWLWILLIVVSIVILGVQFSIFFSSSVETSGFGFYSSLFNVFLVLILGGLFAVIRLKTNIDKEKISMKFFPFVKKEVAWRDIRKAEVLDYGFVGGWASVYGQNTEPSITPKVQKDCLYSSMTIKNSLSAHKDQMSLLTL